MKAESHLVYKEAMDILHRNGGSVYTGRLVRQEIDNDILANPDDWQVNIQDKRSHSCIFVPEPKAFQKGDTNVIARRVSSAVMALENWQRGG